MLSASIADGNVREMVWDYRGRITKLTDRSSAGGAATLVVDYGYDAMDRLSSKKVSTGGSSKVEANVWDDAFLLIQLEGTGGDVLAGAITPTTYRVSEAIFAWTRPRLGRTLTCDLGN